MTVAFGERSLEPLVDKMLAQNPDDLEALIRKSELLIERGDRNEALQLLARARQMDQENDEIRMLSVSALLGQLRENPTANPDLIAQLDSQIDRPAQRVEYLSLLVRSALQRSDFKEAVERLVDLSSLLQSNPLLEPSAKEISDESGRHSSLDDWIAARIWDIFNDSTETDKVGINQRLSEFATANRHGTTAYLEHMVRLFGPWSGITPMRQELEQRLRDDGEFLKLERLALGTHAPSARGLASLDPERLLSLASTYVDGQLPQDALSVLDTLDRQTDPFDKDRAADIRQAVEAKIVDVSWPDSAQLNWESRKSSIRTVASYRQRPSPTKVQAGSQFEGWTLVSDPASAIAMRDPTGLVRRVPANRIRTRDTADKQAQICGGFMAVMTTNGLTGIDLFRLLSGDGEAILWNRSFGAQSGSLARRRQETTPFDDQVIRYYITQAGAVQNLPELKLGPIVGDRLILLQGGELLAIDLLTSTTLWRNSNAPESGVIVTDGQRVAVVSPVAKRVDFFSLMDGRKVGSQAWIHEDVWSATETNVLAYQDGPNKKTIIKLINPFSGEVLLEHSSVGANRKQTNAPCAYGRVVQDRYLALLGNDGSTLVWDLRDARELSTATVTPYEDLQGLQVMLLRDQIVLMPRRRQVRSRKPQEQQLLTRSGASHQTIDGMHAISLTDGSVQWHHDFEKSWGCTLTQPKATPLLMLSRSYATYTVRSRRKSIEALALDVRNGKELHPAKLKPVNDNINELETNLVIQAPSSLVVATIGPEVLTYTFGKPKSGKAQEE
ncbi:MAG: tetratricopeptide repeat protein [Pirellulaceae bacterium]|nr:tetratricopeptide repeat protein [Pirellulaceae bacterium]